MNDITATMGVSGAGGTGGTALGRIFWLFGLKSTLDSDVSKAKKGVDDLERKTSAATEKMIADWKKVGAQVSRIGTGMSVALTLPLVGAGVAAVKYASDAEEMKNKFSVLFGSMSEDAEAWAETTSKAMGRSKIDIMSYMADTMAVLDALGMSESEASDLTKQIVQNAIDMASFHNAADADVLDAYKSALVGMTEPMRRYGSDVTDISLKQYLLNKGITKSVETLPFLEKAQYRMAMVYEQSSAAHGDAARTLGSFANQMKVMQGQIKDNAAAMGEELLPYAQALISTVTSLTGWFGSLTDGQKSMVVGFGMWLALLGPALFMAGKLITTITALTAAKEALTLATLKATAAERGWLLALATNPYMMAAAAIIAVAAAVAYFTLQARNAVTAQDKLRDATSKSSKELRDMARDAKKHAEQMVELNAIYGFFGQQRALMKEVGGSLVEAKQYELLATLRGFYEVGKAEWTDLNREIAGHETIIASLRDEYALLADEIDRMLNIDEEIDDLNRSLRSAALDISDAEEALNSVMASPKSTEKDKARAQIAYESALDNYEGIEKKLKEATDEKTTLEAGGTISDRQARADTIQARINEELAFIEPLKRTEAELSIWIDSIDSATARVASGTRDIASAWQDVLKVQQELQGMGITLPAEPPSSLTGGGSFSTTRAGGVGNVSALAGGGIRNSTSMDNSLSIGTIIVKPEDFPKVRDTAFNLSIERGQGGSRA